MRFFLFVLAISSYLTSYAQQSDIRTVCFHPVGNPFAEPVIELGSEQQLMLSFDDLSPDYNTYSYKIIHCDPNWNNSNLSSFSYLTGFFTNPIDDYDNSFNTTQNYVHYTLTLPNDQINVKLSGNYLLQIVNDNNPDSAVINCRFSVLDNKVAIQAAVVNCIDSRYLYTSQQLNFTVNYSNLPIYNPIRDVKAYVTQNQDPNTRREFSPTFVRQNQLVYGDGENNIFNGLSPFRNFESSSLVYYTQYVRDVLKSPDGIYNFILQPGVIPKTYTSLPDRGGNFVIQAENVANPDLEADYVEVHFALYYPEPLPQADVYVYGKFSDWSLPQAQKMTYDFTHKAYVGQLLLKQGYYDYMYAVVPAGTQKPNLVTMQNNFYQTLNTYNIRFYLYNNSIGYYQLVGYKVVGN